ncbi:MAG: bifunctional 5,10-methylenetetrahydrofolate dehydrogenase/5,10-methenyltetrahydrofolate cyclohydrolase [Paracoccaceae bacterium]
MPATVINGKRLAGETLDRTARRAAALSKQGCKPCLAALWIGDDPATASYARSQKRLAKAARIAYRPVSLQQTAGVHEAEQAVDALNADAAVHGIMLFLPVPEPIDGFALQQRIAPAKDVEGVGAENLGLLAMGRPALAPCTAAAAMACVRSACETIEGKQAVVVGRSVIVGKPLAMLLLAAHATVTQCHTRTRDLAAQTRRAEILVAAAGVPGLIGAEHVSPGAVVIDVGIHRLPADAPAGKKMKIVGDVRFQEVAPVAAAITPVPGGVGPLTVAMLLENTVTACERSLRATS